ncbi:protein ACTIVITY OF BC1 COMPLEX KINASE 8, chloroplastic [Mangifera indica]|uniref:protein ACTIVITY OF BC1 COMPLEX KINASE 8, chloroplastic n=1 Tax=Mangifera indica TaxID=29780 RepID=UPI001CFADC5F|nr:protein ACTIVITY OF BC1 COMPLEX KINASE 8, chloroplastic [Mangifera indica]
MASCSASLALPELSFSLSKPSSIRRIYVSKLSLCRPSWGGSCIRYQRLNLGGYRARIQAVKEENIVVEEKREDELVEDLKGLEFNGNGNGAATRRYDLNSSLNGYSNGSLVKYVNGNGLAVDAEVVGEFEEGELVDELKEKMKEDERKKKVEEIGKEEAWFKKSGLEKQIEVSVAPGGRWSRFKTYSTIQRTMEIWGFVLTFIFKAWLNNLKFTYRGGMTEEKKTLRRKSLAKWLKESILRLGPTFIKIGQQFSTRVDILAQEYVDQLSELQDQVPPFPSETAVSIVEEELGAPVDDIFDRFDFEPIAAASLGQVHRARLKGQEVVVKVQRPGLKDLFDIDLKNLRVIAEYLQKVDPKSDGAKRDWVAIYDECASVLYQEIDYTKEAENAEHFATNFKDTDYIKVPTIMWECTTAQVLTMEYVPGIKINKIQALDQLGVDRKRLGRYAVESYLEQILSHGFFHADPHPGNIAVDDVNGGRLIFYDFGMMGSISPNIRGGLLETFYGVYEKDADKVLQAMIQMGVLVPTGDVTAVRRTAQFFLNSFEERLAAQRREREMATAELGFKKQLTKEEKIEKKKQRLAAIGEDLLAIAADQPFRFPATFTFVVRAFSVLDGIGKGLDPRFDITEIAKPYALELLKFREAGVEVILKDFRNRWDRQSRAFYNLFRQADRVEKLAETIQRLEQGDLKLRVRTLESERAFQRVAAVQKTVGSAVAAGSLVNLATILYLNSIRTPAIVAYTVCAFFSFQVLIGIIKVKKLDEREKFITGTA